MTCSAKETGGDTDSDPETYPQVAPRASMMSDGEHSEVEQNGSRMWTMPQIEPLQAAEQPQGRGGAGPAFLETPPSSALAPARQCNAAGGGWGHGSPVVRCATDSFGRRVVTEVVGSPNVTSASPAVDQDKTTPTKERATEQSPTPVPTTPDNTGIHHDRVAVTFPGEVMESDVDGPEGDEQDVTGVPVWWLNDRAEVLLEVLRPDFFSQLAFWVCWGGALAAAWQLRRVGGSDFRWECVDACGNLCPADWWITGVNATSCQPTSTAAQSAFWNAELEFSVYNRRVHVVGMAQAAAVAASATPSAPPTAAPTAMACPPLDLQLTVDLCRGVGAAYGPCPGSGPAHIALSGTVPSGALADCTHGICWGPSFLGSGLLAPGGSWRTRVGVRRESPLAGEPPVTGSVYLLVEREGWVRAEVALRLVLCFLALAAAGLLVWRLVKRQPTRFGVGPAPSGFVAVWAVYVLLACAVFANPMHIGSLRGHSMGGWAEGCEDWGVALWLYGLVALAIALLDVAQNGQRVLERDSVDGVPRSQLDAVQWLSWSHLLCHWLPLFYLAFSLVLFGFADNSLPFVTFKGSAWREDAWPIAVGTIWHLFWLLWMFLRANLLFAPVTGLLWSLSVVRNRALGGMVAWLGRYMFIYAVFETVLILLHQHWEGFYDWPWAGASSLGHSCGEYVAAIAVCTIIVVAVCPAPAQQAPPLDWREQIASGNWNAENMPRWFQTARCAFADEAAQNEAVESSLRRCSSPQPQPPPPVFCYETCARLLAASWEVYGGPLEGESAQRGEPTQQNPQSGGQKMRIPADFRAFLSYDSDDDCRMFSVEDLNEESAQFSDREEDRCVVVDTGDCGVIITFRGTMMAGKTALKNWKSNLLACWEGPQVRRDAEPKAAYEVDADDRTLPDTDGTQFEEATLAESRGSWRSLRRNSHTVRRTVSFAAPPGGPRSPESGAASDGARLRRANSRLINPAAPLPGSPTASAHPAAEDDGDCRCRGCRRGVCWCPGMRCAMRCRPRPGRRRCFCRMDSSVLVHRGFRETMEKLCHKGLLDHVLTLLSKPDSQGKMRKCYVTGHSRGGALAVLFAYIISSAEVCEAVQESMSDSSERGKMGPIPGERIVVYTFGAPRMGNFGFAAQYDRQVPHTFRVCGALDPVPHLPHGWMLGGLTTWKHVGTRVVLNGSNGDMLFSRGRPSVATDELLGPFSIVPTSTMKWHRVVGGDTSYFSGVLRTADEGRIQVAERSELHRLLIHLAVWNPVWREPWLMAIATGGGAEDRSDLGLPPYAAENVPDDGRSLLSGAPPPLAARRLSVYSLYHPYMAQVGRRDSFSRRASMAPQRMRSTSRIDPADAGRGAAAAELPRRDTAMARLMRQWSISKRVAEQSRHSGSVFGEHVVTPIHADSPARHAAGRE